jgi:hypothetical protein
MAGPTALSAERRLVPHDRGETSSRLAAGRVAYVERRRRVRLRPGLHGHHCNELTAEIVLRAFEKGFALGTWKPRYTSNPLLQEICRAAPLAPTAAERGARPDALQTAELDFAPAVFLAEQTLFKATNVLSSRLLDPANRLNPLTPLPERQLQLPSLVAVTAIPRTMRPNAAEAQC